MIRFICPSFFNSQANPAMYLTIFLFGNLLASCAPSLGDPAPSVPEKAINQSNMITIDLTELVISGKMPKEERIHIDYDPVLKKEKEYLAYSLNAVLAPYIQQMELTDSNKALLTFFCKDGYAPNRYLEAVLPHEGYIAFKDLEAPEGKNWIDSLAFKLSPFYLVWKNSPDRKRAATWSYGLDKIRINAIDTLYNSIFPHDKSAAVAGFEQFKTHCIKCHSINKMGGMVGPELNFPKNILEYWQVEDIWQFAKNPQSYRYNSKMHSIQDLSREAFDDIVVYLEYMKEHKIN